MEVEVAAGYSVFRRYPRGVAFVVFVVPVNDPDVAVPHQFVDLILIGYSPFSLPQFVSHHVIFRARNVTVDLCEGVLSVDVRFGVISFLRTRDERNHRLGAVAIRYDGICRSTNPAGFFTKQQGGTLILRFQLTPREVVAPVVAGVQLAIHEIFSHIAVGVVPLAFSFLLVRSRLGAQVVIGPDTSRRESHVDAGSLVRHQGLGVDRDVEHTVFLQVDAGLPVGVGIDFVFVPLTTFVLDSLFRESCAIHFHTVTRWVDVAVRLRSLGLVHLRELDRFLHRQV